MGCVALCKVDSEILERIAETAIRLFLDELVSFSLSKIVRENGYIVIEGDDGNLLCSLPEQGTIEHVVSFLAKETANFITNPGSWNIVDLVGAMVDGEFLDRETVESLKRRAFSISYDVILEKAESMWRCLYIKNI